MVTVYRRNGLASNIRLLAGILVVSIAAVLLLGFFGGEGVPHLQFLGDESATSQSGTFASLVSDFSFDLGLLSGGSPGTGDPVSNGDGDNNGSGNDTGDGGGEEEFYGVECQERGGTCQTGDPASFTEDGGRTEDGLGCEEFCYIPSGTACQDRGGQCVNQDQHDAGDGVYVDEDCHESTCYIPAGGECEAMGGTCIPRGIAVPEGLPGTRERVDCYRTGRSMECYLPAGTQCENRGGVCKPEATRDEYDESNIVEEDCEGFCYVPDIPDEERVTCDREREFCLAKNQSQFCADGVMDPLGCQAEGEACCRPADIDRSGTSDDTYDIFFVAGSSMSNYEDRVQRYIDGVEQHTPFSDCPDALNTEVYDAGDSSWYGENYDLRVNVHAGTHEKGAFARYRGPVDIYAGMNARRFGPEIQRYLLAHELGHVFGLCDEYSNEAYGEFSAVVGGCHNDWPSDSGWTPYRLCTSPSGSESRTCGAMMGEDPAQASIMGGIGFVQGDGLSSLAVDEVPGLPTDDAEAFKQELEEQTGVVCE